MNRWHFWFMLFVVLGLGAAACAPSAPTAKPPASGATLSPTRVTAPVTPTSPSPLPPTPTPPPSPTPTPWPTPPLTQSWLPEDWIESPFWGGAGIPGQVFSVQRGVVVSADLHPDKPILALGRATGVYLCDLPTDPEGDKGPVHCFRFLPHPGWVGAVAFSPDGSLLATLDVKGTLRLWDWASDPPQARELPAEDLTYLGLGQMAFSDDGRYLALVGLWAFRVWEVASGEPVAVPPVPKGEARVAFVPHTHQCVLVTSQGEAFTLDLDAAEPSWQPLPSLPEELALLGLTCLKAQEGAAPQLAVVGRVNTPTYWQPRLYLEEDGSLWRQVNLPKPPDRTSLGLASDFNSLFAQGIAPGPAGSLLVANGDDDVYLYRVDGHLEATFTPPAGVLERSVVLVRYRAEADQVVGVWMDGAVAVWDAKEATLTGWAPDIATFPIEGIGFDPWGRFLSIMPWHHPGLLRLGPRQFSLGAHFGARAFVMPSTGCHVLYYNFTSAPFDPHLFPLCSFEESTEEADLPEAGYNIPPVSLAATDWIAMVTDDNRTLEIWDPFTATQVRTLDLSSVGQALSLAASPDGRRLFVGGTQSRIGVWDPLTGQQVATWVIDRPLLSSSSGGSSAYDTQIVALTVSADGRRLAAVRADATLAMWDLTNGKALGAWPLSRLTQNAINDGTTVDWVALSPEGRLLFVGGAYNHTLVVVDLKQDLRLATFTSASPGEVTIKALSPDGRLFAYGGGEGAAMVFDVGAWMKRSLGEQYILPLPRLAEWMPALETFRSRYTVTLTLDGQDIPVLSVEATGQHDPWREAMTIQGPGWHFQGQAYQERSVTNLLYLPAGASQVRVALPGDLPPTAPLLRGWPWTYQGLHDEHHRYQSEDPMAAVLPPSTWLRRALDAEAVVFTPQTFQGWVDLTPEGVLTEAHLTWEGELWADGQTHTARVQVTYWAGDFGAELQVPTLAVEPGPSTQGTEATPDFQTDPATGLPLPPGAALVEEGTYQVNLPQDTVAAWYEDHLTALGYTVREAGKGAQMGLVYQYWIVEKEGRVFDIAMSGLGQTTLIVLAER